MNSSDVNRKHIRFHPDPETFVAVKIEDGGVHTGLCLSESQGGCSGVFMNSADFIASKMCLVKVGKLEAVSAEIRWVNELDSDVVKIGLQYLS